MRRSHALLIVIAPAIVFAASLAAARLASDAAPKPRPIAMVAPAQQQAAPAPAPAPVPPPAVPDVHVPRVTLVAVGDIMLSRTVGKTIRAKGDVRFPFLRMRDYLRDADIAFANLETSVTPGRPIDQGEMTFRADPDTVGGLVDAGIDVVSLANNHTPNFGQKGLKDTFRYLRDAGIAYAGAGEDARAAHAPAIVERGGLRFAFLAYNDSDVVPASYAAGPSNAGTAFMDAAAMTAAVRAARAEADVVVVSMHSGREYTYVPDASQAGFARAAIDAGADVVIGHHPHVVQTVERYKDKLIFYSLGNFVFDQMWSDPTREGMALKITFEGARIARADLVPVQIDEYAQPHPSDGVVAERTLARLAADVAERPAWRWDPAAGTFAAASRETLRLPADDADERVRDMEADVDGDGIPERVSVDDGAAGASCAGRTVAVRKKTPDGAWTEMWRSAPGCYGSVDVEHLDGATYVTATME